MAGDVGEREAECGSDSAAAERVGCGHLLCLAYQVALTYQDSSLRPHPPVAEGLIHQ
jgi:hypothetical protein